MVNNSKELRQELSQYPDALTAEETAQMAKDGILIDLKPYLEQYAPDLWAILQENPEYLGFPASSTPSSFLLAPPLLAI